MKKSLLPALLLVALLLPGCAGYELGVSKPAALRGVAKLHVPVFRNLTLEPRIDALVTDTVIRQLQQDGGYVITGQDDADASLVGVIEKITRNSVRSVRGNVLASSELELRVTLSYKVVPKTGGEPLDQGEITGQTNFFVGDDLQEEERQSIPLAVEDLATKLATRLSEGF